MRIGKITFDLEYVVDLDNEEMVEYAKNCIYEDVMSAMKYNEIQNYIKVGDEDKSLTEDDIPAFLTDSILDEEDEEV
jgi:hypothetical protein